MENFWQFSCPTKVIFGNGLSCDFSAEINSLRMTRPLLISDATLKKQGMLKKIEDGLKSAGIDYAGPFTAVPANSSVIAVKKCADFAIENNADGIIAFGGGSVLDTAKAANILLSLGGDLLNDYSGAQTISQPLKPLIAIPTTAGTGSEVTQAAVILDTEKGTKLSFYDQYLHPSLAILDPENLANIPTTLMAATGWDAFTHAMEAYTSLQSNPFSDALALSAIDIIRKAFLPSITSKDDLTAKGNMLLGATLAGIAFDQAMVGVVHSMAHAAGGVSKAHHGTLNFILLPFGMEYNMETCAEKYGNVAKVLGGGKKDAVKLIRDWQLEINKICEIPLRLRDVNVKKEDLTKIAKKACEDGTSFYNPRELIEEEILKTLNRSW